MLHPDRPALVLAPMDGITDAPMRSLQGTTGAFTFAVSEFQRVGSQPISATLLHRGVPELRHGCRTPSGLPVQLQLLGGDPDSMAASAALACQLGATAIDLNFGCPAPTVNRNDGGATLLKYPRRIRAVVAAVRAAVPGALPVSAKLRLGWDDAGSIHENAAMAAEGGASWLTIHARTKAQGYAPPVDWEPIGQVRRALGLPVIANGDIWNLDCFRRCRDQTGCQHFMLGRSALASPGLPRQVAAELGLIASAEPITLTDLLPCLAEHTRGYRREGSTRVLKRWKQWLKLAETFGGFQHFAAIKRANSEEELLEILFRVP